MAADPLMMLTVSVLGLGLLTGWAARPRLLTRQAGGVAPVGALVLATASSSDVRVSARYVGTVVLFTAFGYSVPRVLRLGRTE